ncbi:MAG: hypothetical protein ACREP2_05020 [Rhodanobacteraceae bacterium]
MSRAGIGTAGSRRRQPMSEEAAHIRTPGELLEAAFAWIRKTGWKTHAEDEAIAADVYARWIKATDAEYAATRSRDFERMGNLLREALADTHDEEGLDSLQILLMLELALRGRREGKLKRRLIH